MIYRKFAIIGLGTLGGFVADAISALENTEELIIIDHDIVEVENLKNTIYREIDIGLTKTEALEDIIKFRNPSISIKKFSEKFIEGQTSIPKCNLVLDCRNYTYDRMGEIDARLYLSSRYLIVDCRKKAHYVNKHKGEYLLYLTKDDLRSASYIVSMLINGGTIAELIKDQKIEKYELDHFKTFDNACYDIVYEKFLGGDKFVNLPEKIIPILNHNKKSDLEVIIGTKEAPDLERLIPKGTLKTSGDVVVNLAALTNLHCEFNNYVIAVHEDKRKLIIELIPETGAA